MLKIELLSFDQLPEELRNGYGLSNNGHGRENAAYIRATKDGKVLFIESDAMEPEDTTFYRDLSWIVPALEQCYELGKCDK